MAILSYNNYNNQKSVRLVQGSSLVYKSVNSPSVHVPGCLLNFFHRVVEEGLEGLNVKTLSTIF
jgi:hypothetical protein